MRSIRLFLILLIVCLSATVVSAAYGNYNSFGDNHFSHGNYHPSDMRSAQGNNHYTYPNCRNCNDYPSGCTGSNCGYINDPCSMSGCNSGCGNGCPNCNSGCSNGCPNCGGGCPDSTVTNTTDTDVTDTTDTTNVTDTDNTTVTPSDDTVTTFNPHTGNVYEVGGNGNRLEFVDHSNAVDPTYQQVLDFVKADNTDTLQYTDTYVCSDFAEKLKNDAEVAGIKCAWVGCEFTSGQLGHAFNEFQTTDKGIVYIDCTGVPNPDGNEDKILHCVVGQPLEAQYLFRTGSLHSMGTVRDIQVYW